MMLRQMLPKTMRLLTLFSTVSVAALLGCGGFAGTSALPDAAEGANTLAGNVHGGQQPVALATIQLWAVGAGGDGSASTALLNFPVATDLNGNFSITGDYTCPSASSLVYVTATGGNPGLALGSLNNNLAMMAALGACGNLSSSTFVTINEVTTVGAVMALHPYMTSYSAVGSGTADTSALATAFGTASELVTLSSGVAGGAGIPSGSNVDKTLINTIADVLATCVNSAGGTSGDGSLCGNLFALTGGTATTDTVAAALYIANNPTFNVAALFNLLTPNGPFQPVYTAAPSSFAVTVSPGANSSNYYAVQGQQFLAQIQSAFIQPAPPAGFNLALYADAINPLKGTQLSGNAFLFSEENLIRGFQWGAQVFPSQFMPLLQNANHQIAWNEYQSNYGQCFGTLSGSTCFFDDNSQLAGTLMDIYLHVLPTKLTLTNSMAALNYVLSNVDAQGGIPQTPSGLGQGNFYMNPAVNSGQTDVNYGTIFGNSADVTVGLNYFNEVNDPALGLINSGGLFIGGTTYLGNGQWQPNKVGPLAGESVNVALLALALYRNTGNTSYLQYAENLTNLVIGRFVAANGGVSANAAQGGFGIVNLLCQLYITDDNLTYFKTAQSIIDFILTNDRDTAGYFANGTTTAGNWNNVRTGQPPDADTTLLTQGATAAAILEFAYTDLNYPPTRGTAQLVSSATVTGSAAKGYTETLTVTNTGTAVAQTVFVSSVTLGGVTGTTLPALLGDLLPGASGTVTLTFPASAGADSATVSEAVAGTYIGGTLASTFSTTLP